jgi:hypothetical protein
LHGRDDVSTVLHKKRLKKANSIRCTCMDYKERHYLYIYICRVGEGRRDDLKKVDSCVRLLCLAI